MWDFHVGMEVVRISEPSHARLMAAAETVPVVGRVYTVREIGRDEDDELILWLKEIVNPPVNTTCGFRERGFNADRFRPLRSWSLDCLLTTKVDIDTREKVDG